MRVQIWLKETSQPIEREAISTYEKGSFFCVYRTDALVEKWPIETIFRVVEQYSKDSD